MITTQEELSALCAGNFNNRILTQDEILHWLSVAEAGWMHSGDSKMPHAELASGMCSNGFFFCRKLLRFPGVNEILAVQLAKKLEAVLGVGIDAVVGSPYSAITISYEVAKYFGVPHGIPEKDPGDLRGKKMIWKEEFPEGTKILQIEELITTAGTTQRIREAVQKMNPCPVSFLPVVGVLVHRPPELPIDYWGMKIVALVETKIWAVPPDKCPLCKQGSVRVKPKANWDLLTGKIR
ncbi:hypothetical protein KKC00_02285 [Patescibacteria group bacterium]|nr:hypothetical protein [Patescibacteria group bacterium]